jgi:hypothetical protein
MLLDRTVHSTGRRQPEYLPPVDPRVRVRSSGTVTGTGTSESVSGSESGQIGRYKMAGRDRPGPRSSLPVPRGSFKLATSHGDRRTPRRAHRDAAAAAPGPTSWQDRPALIIGRQSEEARVVR